MSLSTISVSRRAAVSVSAMARAIGLSRSRFYDYVRRGVFPQPVYSVTTRRPFYMTDSQQVIVDVRQSGIGANEEYVLFYERNASAAAGRQPRGRRSQEGSGGQDEASKYLPGLSALGLTGLTRDDVAAALAACFPGGTGGQDEAVVLRLLNRHLRCSGRAPTVSSERAGNARRVD